MGASFHLLSWHDTVSGTEVALRQHKQLSLIDSKVWLLDGCFHSAPNHVEPWIVLTALKRHLSFLVPSQEAQPPQPLPV